MTKEEMRAKLEAVIKKSNAECKVGINQFSDVIEDFLKNDEDFNKDGYTYELLMDEYAPMYAKVYDRLEADAWRIMPTGPAEDAKYELEDM